MATVEVNGTSLYYEESGEGRPLLLLHGGCGDASIWEDQMARLKRFHNIAYDRRGYSRSPLGEIGEWTVERDADDAAGLLKALGATPATLVGFSAGGRVAFDVVRRYPELVTGAVQLEPPLLGLDAEAAAAFVGQLGSAVGQALASGGPRAVVDVFMGTVCPALWQMLPEAGRERYRANAEGLLSELQAPPYQVSTDDLGRIKTPCLVISGTESLPPLRHLARVLADGLPNSHFLELVGAGHAAYNDKPAEFAAAVSAFVDTH